MYEYIGRQICPEAAWDLAKILLEPARADEQAGIRALLLASRLPIHDATGVSIAQLRSAKDSR